MPTAPAEQIVTILSLRWDSSKWGIDLSISVWLIGAIILFVGLLLAWRWLRGGIFAKDFEINEAELGIGQNKIRFRPNTTDRQVAYAIWVELSTRKIGLPIDLDHDVIAEVYNSWYDFFSITRELIKSIPVTQVRKDSTQKIIRLSIEVLNEGLRPHLTRWQARYRAWYDRELKRYESGAGEGALDPQSIQTKFPQFADLKTDMLKVNESLIRYRAKMRQLVMKD